MSPSWRSVRGLETVRRKDQKGREISDAAAAAPWHRYSMHTYRLKTDDERVFGFHAQRGKVPAEIRPGRC